MAGEVQDNIWPLPKFYFSVQLGDDDAVSFQEIDGLDSETEPITYRHGNSPIFYPIKMPGLGKVGNVVMKKGIFVNDQVFWDWYNEIKMNTIARRTVVINLLDEEGSPKMTWDVEQCLADQDHRYRSQIRGQRGRGRVDRGRIRDTNRGRNLIMPGEYYPPPGFYFTVLTPASLLTSVDSSFQEVSGIEADFNVEEVAEGGENRFAHRLPRPARYPNLVLKRGVVTKGSALAEWVGGAIGSNLATPITPQPIVLQLLNRRGRPDDRLEFRQRLSREMGCGAVRFDAEQDPRRDPRVCLQTTSSVFLSVPVHDFQPPTKEFYAPHNQRNWHQDECRR